MLGWDPYGFHKKLTGTCLAELMFLHPVGCVGRVVHSDAPGPRNIDALLFMLGWDPFGFNKKHARKHYAELVFWHPEVSAGHVVHFGAFWA
jgi:hypothetical protein